MPMTAAERQKKYREKLKTENADKYIQYKAKAAQKALQYYKNKRNNMSEEDKIKHRQMMKEKRMLLKPNKTQTVSPHPSTSINQTPKSSDSARRVSLTNHILRNTNKKLRIQVATLTQGFKVLDRKVKIQERKMKQLEAQYDTLIKKLDTPVAPFNENVKNYTPMKRTETFVEGNMPNLATPEKQLIKAKLLEHHILTDSLKREFKTSTNSEKTVLKRIAGNEVVSKYKHKEKISNILGLSFSLKKYQKKETKNSTNLRNKIVEFYNRDDVSRATAGKKEYRTFRKIKRQKRYLLEKLKVLHKKFVSEVGKISFSTFKKNRPFYILSPNIKDCESCACVKHSNMQFMIDVLKSNGLVQTNVVNDVTAGFVCDFNSKDCMYGDCSSCSENKLCGVDIDLNKNECWFKWVLQDHVYGEEEKLKKTKKMMKTKEHGTVTTLLETFNTEMKTFKKHVFNFYHQYNQYKTCLTNLKDNEALIHIDFSENFLCKHHTEVQAMHFGASKVQITLHTGVLYVKDNDKNKTTSFCTISPDNRHNPESIWAHLDPILKHIKSCHPSVTTVHFFSDGPTSQYRQKKNFYLFSKNIYDYGFIHGTWSFFEASHGKGAADGVGGSIKRTLDLTIARGTDITDAQAAFDALTSTETAIKIFYIPAENIAPLDPSIVQKLVPLPQTMKIHQLVTTQKLAVLYRDLSCFCNDAYGKCDCYAPKYHDYNSNKSKAEKRKNTDNPRRQNKRARAESTSSDEDETGLIEYADSDLSPLSFDSAIFELNPNLEPLAPLEPAYNIESDKKVTVLSTAILRPPDMPRVNDLPSDTIKENMPPNIMSADIPNHEIREQSRKSLQISNEVTILSAVRNRLENTAYTNLENCDLLAMNEEGCMMDMGNTTDTTLVDSEIFTKECNPIKFELNPNLEPLAPLEPAHIESDRKITVLSTVILRLPDMPSVNDLSLDTFKQNMSPNIMSTDIPSHEIGEQSRKSSQISNEVTILSAVRNRLENTANTNLENCDLLVMNEEGCTHRNIGNSEDMENTTDTTLVDNEIFTKECNPTEVSSASITQTDLVNTEPNEVINNVPNEDIHVVSNQIIQNETGMSKAAYTYDINDRVMVRYHNRKKWIYYIGFIENIKIDDDDETLYTIRFFKTIKKPLRFVSTKKVDRDEVPELSIVKKVTLIGSNDSKEFFLSDAEDVIYFE